MFHYYYAGNYNRLIRFSDYFRMNAFLKNEPGYRRVYEFEAREYPQYKLITDEDFRDELVVDSLGRWCGTLDITDCGEYRGMIPLIPEPLMKDW